MYRRRFLQLSLVGGAALLAGCTQTSQGGTMRGSSGVLEVARANGAGTFARAVAAAGLEERLSGAGPYTVFAPSDAAFRALPPGQLDTMLRPANRAELQTLVGYHVVPGLVSTTFMEGFEVNHLTATGGTVAVDGTGSPIRVDGARVIRADIGARNGVIHLIDRVLVPA